jgi:hypothetical protein
MTRGKPVILATRAFASQLEANAFFKRMLNSYKPGDSVDEIDALILPRCLSAMTSMNRRLEAELVILRSL